jgi:glycosyltransferase involved in cell wall biosynthesis
VCPVPYAVGVQFKALEAMAMGTPVVTTPQTSTALSARAGEHFLVGESADEFAAHVVHLLNDCRLADRIGAAGRRYVEEHHDWNRLAARLEEVYQRAMCQAVA